ncbi:MAG: phage late control D family protein [Eubacterium sp.]|nr:phage late control D family protein [Eubacterium sp.]
MENAITYKDLYLSFGEVISMNRLEIVQSPDKHGTLSLSAVLNGEGEGEVFDELPEEVSVLYMENGEEKVLFKGMVASSSMERVGNHRKLELKAYDATYLLDKQRKTRSFQDTTRTNHSVIEEIMKEYPECICMKNLPEKPIDRIWFQYEETDWEFLRRFLSSYSDSLYADATYQTARFQAGLSPEDIEVDWDDAPYRMGKNMERYDFLSQNGFDELEIDKFIEYFVDSYGIYTLGSRLIYKGRRWYVGELKRELADGLLTTTYRLEQREGLLKPQEYNHRITGISLDGKTVEVQGDTVRVAMNGDMTTEQGTYWFPFSTVASSPDGSGWYSMPEVGDSIRVYFPTCDEKEGYVITKHDSHMPASGGASGGDSGKMQQQEKLSEPQENNQRITGVSPDRKAIQVQGDMARVSLNGDMALKQGTFELSFSAIAISADRSVGHRMSEVGESIHMYLPAGDEKEGAVITEYNDRLSALETVSTDSFTKKNSGGHKAGGNSGESANHGGGGNSESGGGSGDGGNSGAGGGFGDGGGSESGGGGGGASAAGGSAAAENAAASDQKDEKRADPEKENPMDDPSKRNIFTQDGCVVQMVPAGVILTAGKSTLMLKKTGEIVMDAPTGISVYAGEKMTMTARKITVKAKSFVEIKNESGADIAIRKQQIKMHGQEIYEN